MKLFHLSFMTKWTPWKNFCCAPCCHHLTVIISQYPPLDIGNSFCLKVRMFGSGPKGLRFYLASTVVTRKNTQHLLSVPLLDGITKIPSTSTSNRWQHLNFYTKLSQIQSL
ncbi:hypothetical protein AVEN_15127-1 [Araneus ventricosus]|uniref:Uncharacterized protein n=1 Tax=Araneus ventricosus TaxID=182803 RepID=A0A4Y2T132_ARAVE|nr:hypothetical protein AVEN_15127-1 [Araneus ventricosus]